MHIAASTIPATTIPGVTDAILAARDAWDVTGAVNRIGDWSGIVTGSDCPVGQPLQIGAFDFFSVSCPVVDASLNGQTALAITDVVATDFPCPQCGTLSISVNLAYAVHVNLPHFSLNPNPGQIDLQSVLTHEFGHLLGLRHMKGVTCTTDQGLCCAQDPNKNTMQSDTCRGDTCQRDLSQIDIANANTLYGASPGLSVSPTTEATGGSVTAMWSGIASPTATDWIG